MKKFVSRTLVVLILAYLICNALGIIIYSRKDETCVCDTAIVLGAAASDNAVSPVYRERLNHAITLYNNGYVKAIITTGGQGDGRNTSDAYAAKIYLIENGIPESDILTEDHSTITEENLSFSKEIMNEYGYETALIVSDPLHMKRSMLMAHDYGIKAFSSPTQTTMYRSIKTKFPFLCREEFFYIGYKVFKALHINIYDSNIISSHQSIAGNN